MNIEQAVKQAIEEFGDDAHKRFIDDCNVSIHDVQLKPLPELFAHDVKFYGADAHLMWEWVCTNEITAIPAQSNKELDFKKKGLIIDGDVKRKNSAALPFELDRAIAGDVVEIMVDGEWKTCSIFECDNKTFSATAGDYWTGGSVINDADFLRMKFPKKAAI